mmetsp:Transcript_3380/g.13041  ORF Transcript_3380/g.13041 Transcript_3380/m.13041 type:complete len:504 (+) Transcript_3380:120-1631(+)
MSCSGHDDDNSHEADAKKTKKLEDRVCSPFGVYYLLGDAADVRMSAAVREARTQPRDARDAAEAGGPGHHAVAPGVPHVVVLLLLAGGLLLESGVRANDRRHAGRLLLRRHAGLPVVRDAAAAAALHDDGAGRRLARGRAGGDVVQERVEPALDGEVVLDVVGERVVAQRVGQALAQRLARAEVVGQAEVAADDVLEEADRGLVDEGGDHVGEDGRDGVEALGGRADVVEPHVVEQDLLDDEGRDGLRQFRSSLHDAQTQRDDLGLQQKVDDVGVVHLDERADDAERRQAQVFEGTVLRDRVEERVQVQRHVRVEKQTARLGVRRDALQQRQRVAHAVRRVRRQIRRAQHRVDRHDLLQESAHRAEAVPQDRRQVREGLALLAQLEQRRLALLGRLRHGELQHERIQLLDALLGHGVFGWSRDELAVRPRRPITRHRMMMRRGTTCAHRVSKRDDRCDSSRECGFDRWCRAGEQAPRARCFGEKHGGQRPSLCCPARTLPALG